MITSLLLALGEDVCENSVGILLELGHVDVVAVLIQEVPLDIVDVVLEELCEHNVEVYSVVLEAAEDHEPEVVGCLEHIEPVLVRLEVVELHIVFLRRESPAQSADLHCSPNRIHYPDLLVELFVVVHCLGVVAQLPIVQKPIHAVEDEELVDYQVVGGLGGQEGRPHKVGMWGCG